MAFDTDGIGRTYLQLKNAGNSFSLNCKYFFLLELGGVGKGGGENWKQIYVFSIKEANIFQSLL